jgi:hypothetical protein
MQFCALTYIQFQNKKTRYDSATGKCDARSYLGIFGIPRFPSPRFHRYRWPALSHALIVAVRDGHLNPQGCEQQGPCLKFSQDLRQKVAGDGFVLRSQACSRTHHRQRIWSNVFALCRWSSTTMTGAASRTTSLMGLLFFYPWPQQVLTS